jgi:multiple sugar transport system permease protein
VSALDYRTRERLVGTVRVALLAAFVVGFLFPFYWIVKTSIEPEAVFYERTLLFPGGFTMEHYQAVLDVGFIDSLVNSLIVAVGTMVLTTTVALLAAFAITRYIFPGRGKVASIILFAYMFPNTALIVPLYQLASRVGMLNNPLTLVLLHSMIGLPFSTWILQSYLESIPREQEEAALVEGATEFQAFTRITIPQAAPAVIAVSILAFIMSWGEFMFAYVLTTESANYTVPVKITQLLGGYQVDWGLLAAASVVACLPVLALFWLMVKYLGRGIAKGTGAI